jgi:hypothetical protein
VQAATLALIPARQRLPKFAVCQAYFIRRTWSSEPTIPSGTFPTLSNAQLSNWAKLPLALVLQAHPQLETLTLAADFLLDKQSMAPTNLSSTHLCCVGISFSSEKPMPVPKSTSVNLGALFDIFTSASQFPKVKHIRIFGWEHAPPGMTGFWTLYTLKMGKLGTMLDDEDKTPFLTLLNRRAL